MKKKRKTNSEVIKMSKVNTIRNIVHRNIERQLVREYLLKETERAGFGGLEFNRNPDGTKVTLQAEQVGRVIGRRGKVIHELQRRLKEDFNLEKPHLEVNEIEEPRLNAQVMASRLASSLERGWFFRRAGHSTSQNIMDAGARGCLIICPERYQERATGYKSSRRGTSNSAEKQHLN